RQVGILGEEFMIIQAREGLHFIVRGRPWKIEKIGKDGMVYVTPVSDPNAMIPGWDGEMLPVPFGLAQRVGRIRKEIDARLDEETLEGGLQALLTDHLPLGYYMKGIAERFGAIRRGLTVGEGDLRSFEVRFANTPIYDEAVREALLLHADFTRVREIIRKIRSGEIEVVIHRS